MCGVLFLVMPADLSSLFADLQRLRIDIDECLAAPSSVASHQRLSALIDRMERVVEEMQSESAPSAVWKSRISKAAEDLESARTNAARVLGRRTAREEEEMRREQLFGPSRNGVVTSEDLLLKERGALMSSHTAMDDIITQGRASLDNILNQNAILKGAKSRLLNLLNATGLSSALSKRIGSRERADALIVYACGLLVFLLIFILWYFLR